MSNRIISPLDHEDPSRTGLDYDTSRQPTPFFTFGIEFEMMPAVLTPSERDPHPEDPRPVPRFAFVELARSDDSYTDSDASGYDYRAEEFFDTELQKHITETLNHSFADFYGKPTRDRELPYALEILNLSKKLARHQLWLVSKDGTLEAPEKYADQYDLRDVEVSSPAFVYNEDSIAEVRKFCEIMRNNYRVYIAGRLASSIHVHVGAGSGGFSFETLRNIAAIIWTFGPQLEELHASHRTKSLFCRNLWSNTKLSNIVQSKIGKDGANMNLLLLHGLNTIKETKTVSDIISTGRIGGLLSEAGNYSLAYNFYNLSEDRYVTSKTPKIKRTIEFRQHEGSLDPEEIEQWVAVCVGIIRFADLVKSNKLFSFLESCLTGQRLSIIDVLEALKMPMAASFWGKKIQERVEKRVK